MNNSVTNPLNPFSPHMFGWVEPNGSRQPDVLALPAIRMPEQGRVLRAAQALRVTEQVEQTLRASMAFEQ